LAQPEKDQIGYIGVMIRSDLRLVFASHNLEVLRTCQGPVTVSYNRFLALHCRCCGRLKCT
jgi:hypothetical protein